MEPVWRKLYHWPATDFDQLTQERQWARVLSHLSVFQFSEKYAAHGDIRQIATLVELLHKSHVKIALQGVGLIATTACGLGVEGYGAPDETKNAAERLISAGATINYIVLDEPLLFGHFFRQGKTTIGCNLSLHSVLEQVVAHEHDWKLAIPGVQVGDAEPVGLDNISTEQWKEALKQWLTQYEGLTGHKWAFLQADVVWSRPNWQEQLAAVWQVLKDDEIPVGIFYTGNPADRDNKDWARTIHSDLSAINKEFPPSQQAIFASWTDIPRRFLPETEHDTVTGTVLDYINNGE